MTSKNCLTQVGNIDAILRPFTKLHSVMLQHTRQVLVGWVDTKFFFKVLNSLIKPFKINQGKASVVVDFI